MKSTTADKLTHVVRASVRCRRSELAKEGVDLAMMGSSLKFVRGIRLGPDFPGPGSFVIRLQPDFEDEADNGLFQQVIDHYENPQRRFAAEGDRTWGRSWSVRRSAAT
jgi:hypothetical protein